MEDAMSSQQSFFFFSDVHAAKKIIARTSRYETHISRLAHVQHHAGLGSGIVNIQRWRLADRREVKRLYYRTSACYAKSVKTEFGNVLGCRECDTVSPNFLGT